MRSYAVCTKYNVHSHHFLPQLQNFRETAGNGGRKASGTIRSDLNGDNMVQTMREKSSSYILLLEGFFGKKTVK